MEKKRLLPAPESVTFQTGSTLNPWEEDLILFVPVSSQDQSIVV